jgi:hypothetical protein
MYILWRLQSGIYFTASITKLEIVGGICLVLDLHISYAIFLFKVLFVMFASETIFSHKLLNLCMESNVKIGRGS